MNKVLAESTLTCPLCSHVTTEIMPTDACRWFHECERCRVVLTPKEGDCCVFCSYGSVPCPPIQAGQGSTGTWNAGCIAAPPDRSLH